MKLQRVEKLEKKKVISSIKIYTRPFTLVIRFEHEKFKVKFGSYNNSNINNSLVVFTFSVLNRKYCFWLNVVQGIKTICLG